MIDLDELERLEREATAGPWRDDNGLRVYAPDPDPAMADDDYESLLFSTKHTAANSADSTLCVALRNAARELIADARRYRWLRSRVSGETYRNMGVVYNEGGEGIDAAIDAAIAKEKK